MGKENGVVARLLVQRASSEEEEQETVERRNFQTMNRVTEPFGIPSSPTRLINAVAAITDVWLKQDGRDCVTRASESSQKVSYFILAS
jgi:hypothetical protein